MLDKLENGLILIGASVGLAQIETILGVIILVCQIVLIIYKGVVKIYNDIKDKNYDTIDATIKDTIDDLKDLEKEDK